MNVLTSALGLILSMFVLSCESVEVYPRIANNFYYYKGKNVNTTLHFVEDLDKLLERKDFGYNASEYGPCRNLYVYGFFGGSGGPCIFFLFSNVFDERPDAYNSTTLPKDAPNYLRAYISAKEMNPDPSDTDLAYLTCEGEYPDDQEAIGPLHYYRNNEIRIRDDRSFNTLIALNFERPNSFHIIDVKCTVWAHFKTKADEKTSVFRVYLLIE